MPCNSRSFLIVMAIILLCQVININGFTIRRTIEHKAAVTSSDFIAEESALLEVKHDLKRPNGINNIETKTENINHKEPGRTSENTKLKSSDVIKEKTTISNINNKNNPTTTVDDLRESYGESTSTFFSTITSENILTKTTNFDINNEDSKNVSTLRVSAKPLKGFSSTLNFTQGVKSIPTYRFTETPSDTKVVLYTTNNLVDLSKTNTQSPESEVTSTVLDVYNNKTNTSDYSLSSNSKEVGTNKDITNVFEANVNDNTSEPYINNDRDSSDTEISSPPGPLSETTKEINTIYYTTFGLNYENASTVTTDIDNFNSTLPLSSNSTITSITVQDQIYDTTTNDDFNIELETTVTKFDEKSPYSTPDFTSTPTQYDTDMTAETSHTRLIFDKSISLSPMSTLEKIKPDRVEVQNQLLHNQVTPNPVQPISIKEPITTTSMSSDKKHQLRIGTFSSLRAGYLDYSGKTSTTGTAVEKKIESLSSPHESIDLGDNDTLQLKTKSSGESQSQLVDDAIKEELLKEEMLNDPIQNKQSRDDREENLNFKIVDKSITENKQTTQSKGKTFEEALSVQPISHEQGKILDLYVVSPKYKPLKRIEVQPVKPFVRDLDDNSWRNESISSLGIVFKPKNSSKSFTQVLKNKTETELNTLSDRYSKTGLPDLRERLEKIAEVRKSKKKRVNKNGDTVYSDYEENNISNENITTGKMEMKSEIMTQTLLSTTTTTTETTSTIPPDVSQNIATQEEITKIIKENIFTSKDSTLTTHKPGNKFYNLAEYYDTTDEYDADYITLSNLDIKKFTNPVRTETTVTSPPPKIIKPLQIYLPERKPTVEYFPPRVTPKVNINDYDSDFQRKINSFIVKDSTKPTAGSLYETSPIVATYQANDEPAKKVEPIGFPLNRQQLIHLNKDLYYTETPIATTTPNSEIDINEGNYNRPLFVIKHYQDFLNTAAKDDDDRNSDYVTFTEPPLRGITMNELAELRTNKVKPVVEHDYDYEAQFRKNILNRLVNDFNQNSERYKVDFPILYNSSVAHQKLTNNGKVLSSSNAYMEHMYGNTETATKSNLMFVKSCDPNCDNLTVELSPAYELHYYVPDQEEKEIAEMKPSNVPSRYKL